MKKGMLVLSLIVMLLIFITNTYADDVENTDTYSYFKEASDSNGDASPGQINSQLNIDNNNIGTASIPSGSTVSVNNGDLTSSNIDVAETKSGIKINTGIDATISRNGNVAVGTAQTIQVGSITITNVNNFKYDDEKKSLAFDAAQKLIESQRMFSLDNLKETTITIQNNVIQTIEAKTDNKQSFKSLLPEGTAETSATKDGQIIIDLKEYTGNNAGSSVTYEVDKATLTIKNQQQKAIITAQPATNKPQTIDITKTEDGYVTRAENSIITISTENADERFVGNETLFEWNTADGITFATLQSPGAYRYYYKELQIDRNGKLARANKTFLQIYHLATLIVT